VSDGYTVYRSYKRRQRCLAHLIRKGVALIDGYDHDAYVDGTLLARAFGSVLIRSLASICPACCRART
jgi:hypothetical protein